jgi:N-acetylneuraminic acid mutarotase
MIIAGGGSAGSTMRVFADAAAYNPVTRTWRKLPPMPGARWGATAVWDGTEVLFIGGTRAGALGPESDGVAFNPATDQWRRLPGMGYYNRWEFAAVWTGRQVLVWGGLTGTLQNPEIPPHGVAYDPAVNLYDWSALPKAPLRGRGEPAAVWTGRQMIVWGGAIPGPQQNTLATDGAAYQPSSR